MFAGAHTASTKEEMMQTLCRYLSQYGSIILSPSLKEKSMKRETLKSVLALCLAPAAALCLVSAAQAQTYPSAAPSASMHEASKTTAAVEVKMAMRKLWEEHIVYTRNYIISALAGLPDSDAVAQRLLGNQDDIGNAIKPYYGEAAGNKLSVLLRDHIMIATGIVKAAKAGDKTQLADAQKNGRRTGKRSLHS